MRSRYRWRDGTCVDHTDPRFYAPAPKRSHLPCPAVISDSIDIVSMADGRPYDSKSAYYRSVKAAGCEVVGNDAPTRTHEMTTPGGVGEDIKTAIEQLQGQT